LQNPDKVILIL